MPACLAGEVARDLTAVGERDQAERLEPGLAIEPQLADVARARREHHALEGPRFAQPLAQHLKEMQVEVSRDLGGAHPERHAGGGLRAAAPGSFLVAERLKVDAAHAAV